MSIFFVLGLLVCIASGSTDVFVLKGNDIRLDVKVRPDYLKGYLFTWRFKGEKELNVIRYSNGKATVHMNYRGRVEFSTEDFSFRLKNLQKNDTGVYTAGLFWDQFEDIITYNVTVQESVSPPVLEVNVSSSSDSCNLAVSCSSQNSSISSTVRCDTQTCSQEGGGRSEVTTAAASLYVYLSNDSIICNHSNQVSWREDMKEMKPLCWDSPTPGLFAGVSGCRVKIILWSVGLFLMVSAVISVHLMYGQDGSAPRTSRRSTRRSRE